MFPFPISVKQQRLKVIQKYASSDADIPIGCVCVLGSMNDTDCILL